ncbi:cytochrome P450 [Suillus hirtellus]|nr:cytochrome P450 [Suillus hirtellus]
MMVVAPMFDPLKNIQGPDGSPLQNHLREIMDPSISLDMHDTWVKLFGKTFRFHRFGRHDFRPLPVDPCVMNHEHCRRTCLVLSVCIFAMEGAEHKALRKLIAPAFSIQSIKIMTSIFFQKAEELRDKWEIFATSPSLAEDAKFPPLPATPYSPSPSFAEAVTGVAHWLSLATSDVLGLTNFDYDFHALQCESEEVHLAHRNMFRIVEKSPKLRELVQLYFPIIEKIFPTNEATRITNESRRVINEAGQQLIQSKKFAILAEKASVSEIEERDIISLLNISRRLSDADLLSQLSTFLFAGSDSTSLTMSWCIHLLSIHPDVQGRLRSELNSMSSCASNSLSMSGYSVPIEALDLGIDIWGGDARLFNPDRWSSLPHPARAPSHPEIANVMTFSFGPHACPGWKSSMLETKIFLATLIPHFVFEPAADIQMFNAILTRPYVYDRFEFGTWLPVKIGRVNL